MKITVWDTETTGFATRGWDLSQQPYIIQFAALEGEYIEGQFRELARHNFLMKPPVSIPFWASQVHWIYDKDVADKNPIRNHIDEIIRVLNRAEILSWHNIEYDEEILSYELERLGRRGEYVPQSTICTMRWSTDYCKLQGRWFSYKPPKLSELYKHLFGEWFEWAHDAMVDVEATMRCLVELLDRKVIEPETTNLMRLF